MVHTKRHTITTRGQGDAHDISDLVAADVRASELHDGLACAFVVGSTALLTTIEFEPGAIADLNAVLERLAPRKGEYRHHLRWGHDNGPTHQRAALCGPSLLVPFSNCSPVLCMRQLTMLLESYSRSHSRGPLVRQT